MKKSRTIRSFEPDPDVEEMLETAIKARLAMVEIINEAMRRCGHDIIDQMISDRLKELEKLSFEDPQLPLAGFMIAA